MFIEAFERDVVLTSSGDDRSTLTGREILGSSEDAAARLLAHSSYPLRFTLSELQGHVVNYLRNQGRPVAEHGVGEMRPFDTIIRAARFLRTEIRYMIEDEGGFVGNEEPSGNSQWSNWVSDANPLSIFSSIYDSYLPHTGKGWTSGDVTGLLALWCIEEAVAEIDADQPYKAATWAVHAERYYQWQEDFCESADPGDYEKQAKRSLARRGGHARDERYEPLRRLAKELVEGKNFPSFRNAAMSIAPAIIARSRELGVNMSEAQAEFTITGWLKAMGLPANVVRQRADMPR